MSLLATRGLTMDFGHLRVLDSVDIEARTGEILGLIGPNGSGKSTWMNCVSGAYRPTAGHVVLKGSDVTGRPSHVVYHRGLARTFQLLENFSDMTVRDNLVLSGQERRGTIASRLFRSSTDPENESARSLATFFGIEHLMDERVATLSYGQQKLCDIAMALMSEPEILLLDEPMAGVNPTLVNEIVGRLIDLNAAGTTLVVIEHNMRVMMELCHRMVVLDHGELIADGEPAAIRQDPDVIAAYFGRS